MEREFINFCTKLIITLNLIKIKNPFVLRCNLSQIWGNFSAETVTKLTSVRDIGLALRSEADLLAVKKWIGKSTVSSFNIICEWYRIFYMLLFK